MTDVECTVRAAVCGLERLRHLDNAQRLAAEGYQREAEIERAAAQRELDERMVWLRTAREG